ncbi:hypothetical protein ZHAS_00011182 [Anopheles sinensis]|uniref:Uncharacterized protein n=1 Tax=Anopheles sinensis TaxID=74873 RepID=A0A084VZJ3_ANOSI|nr:hypothetical protein ZHAS_00011182 [Anopheles sinensis]
MFSLRFRGALSGAFCLRVAGYRPSRPLADRAAVTGVRAGACSALLPDGDNKFLSSRLLPPIWGHDLTATPSTACRVVLLPIPALREVRLPRPRRPQTSINTMRQLKKPPDDLYMRELWSTGVLRRPLLA